MPWPVRRLAQGVRAGIVVGARHLGVPQVDLGPESAAPDVERPRGPRDGGGQELVAERPDQHGRPGARVDQVGVPFRNVHIDADHVGAIDDVDRGRGVAGRQVRGVVVGRGVAGARQDKVASVGIASHHHAIVGRLQRQIAHPRRHAAGIALGHRHLIAGDGHVDLVLREGGLFGEQFRLRLEDGRLRRVPGGPAGMQLIFRFQEDLFVHDPLLGLLSQPLHLHVPALDLGLVSGQGRPRLVQAGPSRLNVGLGHLHQLLVQLDLLLIELDRALLGFPVLAQLRREENGQRLTLLDVVADVHEPLLDVPSHLRIDRGALIALDEARLTDDAEDGAALRVDHRDRGDLRSLGDW